MRRILLSFALALGTTVPASPGTHYRLLDRPQDSVYFGHVVQCDLRGDDLDPRVVREGVAEAASVNVPLAAGDRLLTGEGRRCEVEFDSGTVAQLDGASSIRLETVLAPALTSDGRLTNLVVESGRVRIRYRAYARAEVFQVLTANAAVKLEPAAVVDVRTTAGGATGVAVEHGQASVLFGPSEGKTQRKRLRAGESLGILQDHAPYQAPVAERDAFALWGQARDGERMTRTADSRPLPATLRGLPAPVLDFAERLSRAHGEWVWTDLKEHAWRPHLNRDASWRPYSRGRWTAVSGQPFWVADEEWGWVPYHLGYWYDDDDAGWVWLPGSTFAPAWVSYSGCNDSFAWWPFGPQDWRLYRRGGYPGAVDCLGTSLAWYNYPWVALPPPRPVEYAKRRSGSDDPEPEPERPRRPRPERPTVPRELRTLATELDRLAERLGPGDPSQAWRGPRSGAWSLPTARGERDEAEPKAARAEEEPAPSAPSPEAAPTLEAAPALVLPLAGPAVGARFRDWNPDLRVARALGGSIRYDSAQNRVYCDGCRSRPGAGAGFLGSGSATGTDAGGVSGGFSGSPSSATAGNPVGSGASKSGPVER